jgi:hypothetical protein
MPKISMNLKNLELPRIHEQGYGLSSTSLLVILLSQRRRYLSECDERSNEASRRCQQGLPPLPGPQRPHGSSENPQVFRAPVPHGALPTRSVTSLVATTASLMKLSMPQAECGMIPEDEKPAVQALANCCLHRVRNARTRRLATSHWTFACFLPFGRSNSASLRASQSSASIHITNQCE